MDINKSQTIEVCKIAWRAGKKILDIYSKKFKIFRKKDMSPVTIADLESEKIIIKGLKKIFNKPIIFSEESNNKSKKKLKNFWLVDPLDGTKEFIKKNGEFTVNIAFVKDNKPFFGIIYAPKLKKTYIGTNKETYKVVGQKNFKKIIPKKEPIKTMIISRSHSTKNESEK